GRRERTARGGRLRLPGGDYGAHRDPRRTALQDLREVAVGTRKRGGGRRARRCLVPGDRPRLPDAALAVPRPAGERRVTAGQPEGGREVGGERGDRQRAGRYRRRDARADPGGRRVQPSWTGGSRLAAPL